MEDDAGEVAAHEDGAVLLAAANDVRDVTVGWQLCAQLRDQLL
jgi:hypothetical protein